MFCFRSSSCLSVNECRKFLFTKKDRQLEHIPPTKAALYQHFLRAIFQGVHVWGQLSATQRLPSPSDWGWTKINDNYWEPTWTDLPVAAKACQEIVRCKCTKQCGTRCSCQKRQLKCSDLCFCGGTCYINKYFFFKINLIKDLVLVHLPTTHIFPLLSASNATPHDPVLVSSSSCPPRH